MMQQRGLRAGYLGSERAECQGSPSLRLSRGGDIGRGSANPEGFGNDKMNVKCDLGGCVTCSRRGL